MRDITIWCFLVIFSVLHANAQRKEHSKEIHLLPKPVWVQEMEGNFEVTPEVQIIISEKDTAHRGVARLLSERLHTPTGYTLAVTTKNKKKGVIRFVLNQEPEVDLGKEGYFLEVSPKEILVRANQPEGWFYAIQTLLQLLPPSVEGKQKADRAEWIIPGIQVKDYPRFEWRGLMVDVSRHFFPKEVIKSYIDQMAKYKFNTFHFHLTDNHGWRVEIKSLPKLTEVGAWRVPRTGYWKGFKPPQPGEEATDGGFYSQEDIREIVKYAAERFVTIVPEVDIPGHSLALIASYPALSCDKKPQQVLAGDPWNVSRTNVVCAGNDSTYLALDKIFTELAQLFPGEYIHIGGDEVKRVYWDNCAVCQKRIEEESLKNTEELQTYFIKRVTEMVEGKGKKAIGWYEELEGGLVPGMAFMSWKSIEGGVVASQQGHKAVMTPAFHTYLDFYQGDPILENGPFTVNRLSSSYNFNPVPAEARAQNILGGQGSLWTEQVPNERKLQYMTWPRGMALAEVFWTPQEKREWKDFVSRMETHLPRFDSAKVKYGRSFYEPIISAVKSEKGELQVVMDTEVDDLEIYYTFDDTRPDEFYPRYKGKPLPIPKGAHHIRAVTYRNGKRVGRELNLPLSALENRIRK